MTFVQRGMGDVLLAWENEAFLSINELGPDKFEIVVPSVSILAEPTVAVVEKNAEKTRHAASGRGVLEVSLLAGRADDRRQALLPASQREVGSGRVFEAFSKVELFTIDDVFGGWEKAQPEHFDDGGVFDQISNRKEIVELAPGTAD